MAIPQPALIGLFIAPTTECDYACAPCINRNNASPSHMSEKDITFVLEEAVNPFFSDLIMSDREPTKHPGFNEFVATIADFFAKKKMILPSPDISSEHKKQLDQVNEGIKVFYQSLVRKESKAAYNGEWLRIAMREKAKTAPHIINMDLRTNGAFLLQDLEALTSGAINLFKAGFNMITISTDLAHIEYAEKTGRKIDYGLIKGYTDSLKKGAPTNHKFEKIKEILGEKKNRLTESGLGGFALPIGGARNFSWHERLRLAERNQGDLPRIQQQLEREYAAWSRIKDFAHPIYCSVTEFFRNYKRAVGYHQENALHPWGAYVGVDLTVHLCPVKMIPSIGNLKRQNFNTMYAGAVANPLYRIIAEEGPQGIARMLGWKEEDIKAKFIERTPCGLCEDIKYAGGFEKLSH